MQVKSCLSTEADKGWIQVSLKQEEKGSLSEGSWWNWEKAHYRDSYFCISCESWEKANPVQHEHICKL